MDDSSGNQQAPDTFGLPCSVLKPI